MNFSECLRMMRNYINVLMDTAKLRSDIRDHAVIEHTGSELHKLAALMATIRQDEVAKFMGGIACRLNIPAGDLTPLVDTYGAIITKLDELLADRSSERTTAIRGEIAELKNQCDDLYAENQVLLETHAAFARESAERGAFVADVADMLGCRPLYNALGRSTYEQVSAEHRGIIKTQISVLTCELNAANSKLTSIAELVHIKSDVG